MQFYLKITSRGQKYGDFLLNCTKIQLIVLCQKSWQLKMWIDSVLLWKESVLLKARRKKIKRYILMKKWMQLQLTLDNSKFEDGQRSYLDNKQICSRQWEFKFLNVIFYKFCWEGTSEIVWFLECLQQGFVWSSIF